MAEGQGGDAVSDLDEFRLGELVEDLRRQNRGLELRLLRAKTRSADLVAAVFEGARDAAVLAGPAKAVVSPARDRRRGREEAGLLLLSDWHFGKRTSSFDTGVAAERVVRLGGKVARIAGVERADHPVPVCHVCVAGDFVESDGNIFPGQAYEVDSSLFAQLFAAANALEGLLRGLLSTFRRVVVWEQAGNHGRLGRKGDHPREDNSDRLLYRIVWERLRAQKRLSWQPSSTWFSRPQIGAYTALLIHGDQIRSFGGNVPSYGILRKCNAWASGVLGVEFQDVLLGHFHQALSLPLANGRGRAFVNPSIESDSAYAQEFVAASGTPGQRLFFVDPEKGRITSERLIWLDD